MIDDTARSLRVTRLGTRYGGDAWALRGVDLDVPAGSTLAVLGPSGCGKSTLLKLVAGLERPEEGEIRVGDRVLSAPGHVVGAEHRDVGMVFQDFALWPHMRVRDIIGYGLRHGRNRVDARRRRNRVDELIALLRLDGLDDRRPAELSGGQQQRVSIARALATRPSLLLFDEPLSNLDARLRGEMREELAELLRRLDTTALYVTHDVGEALAVADRILVLDRGSPVQTASPHEVFARPSSGWVANLAGFSSRLSPHRLDVAGDHATIDVGSGHLDGRYCGPGSDPGDAPGSVCEAYVHPDGVRLGDGPDAVRGHVVSCVFEGRTYRIRVDLGPAGTVVLTTDGPRDPGAAVGITADTDAVLVFGHPHDEHTADEVRIAAGSLDDG